jgi:hypothetical protein
MMMKKDFVFLQIKLLIIKAKNIKPKKSRLEIKESISFLKPQASHR